MRRWQARQYKRNRESGCRAVGNRPLQPSRPPRPGRGAAAAQTHHRWRRVQRALTDMEACVARCREALETGHLPLSSRLVAICALQFAPCSEVSSRSSRWSGKLLVAKAFVSECPGQTVRRQ